MTNNNKLWIRHKNNKFVVQKIEGTSAVQIAKFNTRKQAETYVDNYKSMLVFYYLCKCSTL